MLKQKTLPLIVSVLALAAVLAGCGSSTAPGVVLAPSNGATADSATAAASTPTTATTTTASVPTPTSGPLSTEPKVAIPKGPAPKTLQIKDLIKGTGAAAKSGGSITVNYVGELYKNGKQFDASWNRHQTFTTNLVSGQGGVIAGWVKGIAGMKVGGRRELIIPSKLGYGPSGSPPTIPPNSPLVFVVDLLKAS
jgi:peptidylprolyl isomerase